MKQSNTMTLMFLLAATMLGTSCKDEIITNHSYVKGEGPFPDYGEVLAFPGAEGFGRNATGGRGGEVYHVTNLDDSGTGSLRDAVSKSNRIIVFDTCGVIRLKSALTFKNNQTIAGQTAPGDGIVLYGDRVSFSGIKNLICRYLRVRMGMNGPDGKDAAGIADDGMNMIFDHCSITWGRDENFSINSTQAKDITIQNSIIGQGLQNHSCGGLIQTGIENGITLFRNLYIDNKTRNPKVKGLNQFVNNVIYNWGDGAAYNMSGDSEGESLTTIEDNYLIKGPCFNWQNVRQEDNSIVAEYSTKNPTKPFIGANERFSTYFSNNFYDPDKDGTLNGFELKTDTASWNANCSGVPTFLSSRPAIFPEIKSQTDATKAYEWIVKYVGACLPARDQVDTYLIDELTSLGTKGTIIQDERKEAQFPLKGPGTINGGKKLLDSDNDGMPDEFEDKYGLDKNDPSDASAMSNNGYTNIENYLFSLEEKLNQ